MEWESEIPKCLFSSVESTRRAPTFSGCAWAELARIFLWTELHVQSPLPGGARAGGGVGESRARDIPAVASFGADVPCLYTAATVVSSLCLLSPHARPCPAVTPFILPLEPQGQDCFKLSETSIGLDLGHTYAQLDHLPTSGEGERRTPDRRGSEMFLVLPRKVFETSRRLHLVQGGERCHSPPSGLMVSPHLASPSASHPCSPSS